MITPGTILGTVGVAMLIIVYHRTEQWQHGRDINLQEFFRMRALALMGLAAVVGWFILPHWTMR